MEKNYQPVRTMRDMTQFGIQGLTGEACAYGMRILCDVNEAGKELLADYFGMPTIQLSSNWNSQVGGEPAIGSVMLAHSCLQHLAQFAFFRAGALAVIQGADGVIGIFEQELITRYRAHLEQYPNCGLTLRVNHARRIDDSVVGSRNVHAFTGRIV